MEGTADPQIQIKESENESLKRKAGSKRRNSSINSESATPESCSSKRPPLRRGSSFTFLTPGQNWDFTLKRKRREKDGDAVSLCSFDFKIYSALIPRVEWQETDNITSGGTGGLLVVIDLAIWLKVSAYPFFVQPQFRT